MIILVPPLLGLKGNLEMTLASRLSTQVISQLPQLCVIVSSFQSLMLSHWRLFLSSQSLDS